VSRMRVGLMLRIGKRVDEDVGVVRGKGAKICRLLI